MEMNNINFRNNKPLSKKAKLIQSTIDIIGLKKNIEKKMIIDDFEKKPKNPGKSLMNKYAVVVTEQKGRKVWSVSPKYNKTKTLILYLHGGGYLANITKEHWKLIDSLTNKTNATVIVPDYPLAAKTKCKEVYDFIHSLYSKLILEYPMHRMIIIGDSAGAGLALGYVQYLRDINKNQPEQIILFSPWLDVTMSNPKIKLIDESDKMLSISGLISAGKKYAGKLDLKDYRVSPIYGNMTGLCKISIFTGTNDILHADALKLEKIMTSQRLNFNYFEYPQMFHDWVMISNLKETINVLDKVKKLIKDYN
ncbi:MAG TPA: alpha/beta hydrolase [Clostridia bacterium]|nr:alpha/beta hydrolase [Clostridia bacterium]